jgi:hypothetical protein
VHVEIIRTREVRGPGGRKGRHTRTKEKTKIEESKIAKALPATNKGIEEALKQEGLVDSAPNSFVTNKHEEVKVRVLRVCANPRLVLCGYQDQGLERRVLVRVRRNMDFLSGMELKAIRPARETEPWEYQGKLPRLRGRW